MVLLVVLAVATGSMPVYAVGRARHQTPLAGKADWHSAIFGRFVQQWFYWFIRPVERTALALGLGPLFFNLAGVALGVVAALLLVAGAASLAGWAILVGGVADILDGQIARGKGVASQRGAFLDSSLDRFAEVAVFVGLAFFFAGSLWGQVLVVVSLGGSLLVSYVRARGESFGVSCSHGLLQRTERVLMLGFGGILDPTISRWFGQEGGALLLVILGIMALGTTGTAIFRTVWISRRLPAVRS